MKFRWDDTRSPTASPSRARRFKRFAIPSGLTALLGGAWLLSISCTGPFVREVSVEVLAAVITPHATRAVDQFGSALLPWRHRPAVGLAFAKELARKHSYWCNVQESEQVCIERISRLAEADLQIVLQRWNQSIQICRQAAIGHPLGEPMDEIRMVDEIFDCMERRGFQRQIEALRASESRRI